MPRLDRKRLDLALDHALYQQVAESAVVDGRSVNAQIGWLLAYALIDWRDQCDRNRGRVEGDITR